MQRRQLAFLAWKLLLNYAKCWTKFGGSTRFLPWGWGWSGRKGWFREAGQISKPLTCRIKQTTATKLNLFSDLFVEGDSDVVEAMKTFAEYADEAR